MAVVSLAVFGPQSCAPKPGYLAYVRSFVSNHYLLKVIPSTIRSLYDVHSFLASDEPSISQSLPQVQCYTESLIKWLEGNDSDKDNAQVLCEVASQNSGIVALPRLAIVQLAQYFDFLESNGLKHNSFLNHLKSTGGSIQGLCGGMPAAFAALLCTSESSNDTVDKRATDQAFIMTVIRLAYAIGIYAELGDDSTLPGRTSLCLRLKREDQAQELTSKFSHIYVGTVIDPRLVSFVGPVDQMAKLEAYAVQDLGLISNSVDLRGKTHNPENAILADRLAILAGKSDLLTLPNVSELRAPFRCNQSSNLLNSGARSLAAELIHSILAGRGEWYNLFCQVAQDMKDSPDNTSSKHLLANFGIGECVPVAPFNKAGIQLQKIDWSVQSFKTIPRIHDYQYPDNAVAIIGAACRLPGARDLEELWELLAAGQDRHEDATCLSDVRFDMSNSWRGGEWSRNRKWYGNFLADEDVKGFDHSFFGNNQREAAYMDPQQRLLLEVCYEAMESSGYTRHYAKGCKSHPSGDDVGVFVGHTYTEYLENTCAHPPATYASTGTIRAFVAGRLSYYFGWTGPAEVIDTACSASVVSINRAVKALQGGECRMAVAGGVNIITGANNYLDLAKTGFLSPTGQCKPFDAAADGYCRGEGAGLVVLKPLAQALKDGDRIMDVIGGSSHRQGGLSPGITYPDIPTQEVIFRDVLRQAGDMHPDQVTYVEAHGTGTQANDSTEAASVRSVFGNPTRDIELHMASIKGNIGHLEVAAGSASLIKVLCMFDKGGIPPQASHKTWNPKIPSLEPDKIIIPKQLRQWDAPFRAALVNGAGAAGSHAALLVCEPPPRSTVSNITTFKQAIILSAATASSLEKYRAALLRYLDSKTVINTKPGKASQFDSGMPSVQAVSYVLSEKRQRYKHRMIFEAENTQQLATLLRSSQASDSSIHNTISPSHTNNSSHSNSSNIPIVLVFGGQSQKSVNLNRTMYETYPAYRARLDEYNDLIVKELNGPAILPAIFGDSASGNANKDVTNCMDMTVLQTGFVASQIAAALTWLDAGLKVDAMIGHSLGELAALAVSGVLSVRDCLRLVCGRAKLMQKLWGDEHGRMTAVFAKKEQVEGLIASSAASEDQRVGQRDRLVVACYNGDTSHVVAGDSQAIAIFEAEIKAAGVKFMPVDTTHGFHSHLVDPVLASGELDQLSASLDWKDARIPLEICANTTAGHTGSSGSFNLPHSVSAHARQPVFFSQAVQRIEERLGSTCFWLEAGFDTPIISMAKRALPQSQQQRTMVAVSPNKEKAHPADAITHVVCMLWRFSHDVTPWNFLRSSEDSRQSLPPHVYLPPYQFDHSNGASLWVNHIDLAPEQQQQMVINLKQDGNSTPLMPSRMVTRLSDVNSDKTPEFAIHNRSRRFQTLMSGHGVLRKPLCPASLYMECVVMAIDILLSGEMPSQKITLEVAQLDFEQMDIHAPLGNAANDIKLSLHQVNFPGSKWKQWEAVISSTHGAVTTTKKRSRTQHAKLRVSLTPKEEIGYHASYKKSFAALAWKNLTSLMGSERLYRLFSTLVAYKPYFKGIKSAYIKGSEAVAEIKVPSQADCWMEESSVTSICETVMLDNFIHIVGFLINSSSVIQDGEVMVCNAIGSFSIFNDIENKGAHTLQEGPYKVYVSYDMDSPTQADCHGFAFSRNGKLVACFAGCRFVKVDAQRLEKALDQAQISNEAVSTKDPLSAPKDGSTFSQHVDTLVNAPQRLQPFNRPDYRPSPAFEKMLSERSIDSVSKQSKQSKQNECNSGVERLREILEVYTGLKANDIPGDVALADMGVDSLAATEMTDELQSRLNITITGADVVLMTLEGLLRLMPVDDGQIDGSGGEDGSPSRQAVSSSTDFATITPSVATTARPNLEIRPTKAQVLVPSIAAQVTDLIVELTGADPSLIKADLSLADIGVDSLALKEVVSTLAERYPDLEEGEVITDTTVGELVCLISRGCPDELGIASGSDSTPSFTPTLSPDSASAVSSYGGTDSHTSSGSPISGSKPCAAPTPAVIHSPLNNVSTTSFEALTVVYKRVGHVEIEADVYLPTDASLQTPVSGRFSSPQMGVALMIHGGGHMTLSRKAVRPVQAAYLLAHNILPVSIDYRLCPEVNILDGAITDVRDAYLWAQKELPMLLLSRDARIRLDVTRIVAIGFSTGGLLATSLGWTIGEAPSELQPVSPPKGILCFYSPLDFTLTDYVELMSQAQQSSSNGKSNPMAAMAHSLTREHILNIELLQEPMTNYMVEGFENAELGWVRPGDTRSELLLSLFREPTEFALSLWLNGPSTSSACLGRRLRVADLVDKPAQSTKISALCPMAHLLAGTYTVPTYIVHGTNDEVAPFQAAARFHEELGKQGVKNGFLAIPNARHLYDLRLKPGMRAWEDQVRPAYQFLFDILSS
ncbi:hypothetical protein BD289DRAFT_488997 [Coniella lustricola]|uniref:Uncharacterized protein n=1 Tax=Coniella lustricola TaxID=2025994 RepID=A0A2T3A2R3_9PEZI|nr:hypothetical protein BD289DRAFT_488997 [Coniella lustricola]